MGLVGHLVQEHEAVAVPGEGAQGWICQDWSGVGTGKSGGCCKEADSSSQWESGKNLIRTRAFCPTTRGLPCSPCSPTAGVFKSL